MWDDLGRPCLIVNRASELRRPSSPAHGTLAYERESGQYLRWNEVERGWTVDLRPQEAS